MTGSLTIALAVLVTIVALTTLATPGIVRLHQPGRPHPPRGGGPPDAVQVTMADGAASVTVAVVVEPMVNMLEVGQAVQRNVARALHDMAGVEIREVNVAIQDVGEVG
jgi:uncharacterized alkaline shock family protein YloU